MRVSGIGARHSYGFAINFVECTFPFDVLRSDFHLLRVPSLSTEQIFVCFVQSPHISPDARPFKLSAHRMRRNSYFYRAACQNIRLLFCGHKAHTTKRRRGEEDKSDEAGAEKRL